MFSIALAQINCTVGDLEGNYQKICAYIRKAKSQGAKLIAFPELALTGYPPEDLLLKPKFIADNLALIKDLAKSVKDIVVVVGFVDRKEKSLYNAAAVIYQGKIKGVYHKMLLPNYGVFDEKRYFTAGNKAGVFKLNGCPFALNICEDIWHQDGPIRAQAARGAKLILAINASPYSIGKIKEREKIICQQAKANRLFIAYLNLVGGQDELVFDGQSMIADNQGKIIARAEALKEDLLVREIDLSGKEKSKISGVKPLALQPVAEIYQVLVLGLRDYLRKNGFLKAVIGLSGGIDSALVASLAASVLGRENVIAVFMPSQYSSTESQTDARELAENLGIKFITIPIGEIYKIYLAAFAPHFAGLKPDITEENLQARIRGNILMALSNKFKWLVLATGNKSEMSTGYATLYGDMAGGFAVLKDVPKILVYQLAQYRNSQEPVIPQRILTKEPSAELKPHQKDSDTLPPYETLDAILKAYIEEDQDLAKITSFGFAREMVSRVLEMVDKSEYKRRQAPPGIKITYKAFGKDRRMPITNKYPG